MESLKPLKILGGLALLCLIIYLALPAGRDNFAERIRTLKNVETSQSASLHGSNAELLSALNDKEINVGLGKPHAFAAATRFLQIGLQSNDPVVLAIASRNASIPILTNYTPSDAEWQKIDEYMTILKAVAEKGGRLDPDNAFFPVQMATYMSFEGDRDEVKRYLLRALNCKIYDEYGWEEGDIKIDSLKFHPSEFERISIRNTVLFPHLVEVNRMLRKFIGNAEPEKNIEDRILVANVGFLIAKDSKIALTHIVGRNFVRTSTKRIENLNSSAVKTYDAKQLESIAEAHKLNSGRLFEASKRIPDSNFTTLDKYFSEWRRLFKHWPAINALPLYSVITTALLVAAVLLSSKFSQKTWFKSIRYLGAFALASPFASSYQSEYVQSFVGTVMVFICIPLALIAYTERLIPIIHVSIAAIAIWVLNPQNNPVNNIVELTLASIFTLLAWHKNRKSDSRSAKILDTGLLLTIPAASIYWIFITGENVPVKSTLNDLTFWLFFGAIGIASSDKMRGRFQANLIASVGFAIFAASLIINIHSSTRLAEYPDLERIALSNLKAEFSNAISDPTSATNPADPSVKPIR